MPRAISTRLRDMVTRDSRDAQGLKRGATRSPFLQRLSGVTAAQACACVVSK